MYCRELNNNKLSSVLDESSPLFIGLTSLLSLGLAANHIQSVSRHAFDGLDVLRHIDLNDNDISSLEDNTFTLNNLHNMSVCLSACLLVCLSVCLSVCPSVCLSVCLSGQCYLCLYICHLCRQEF